MSEPSAVRSHDERLFDEKVKDLFERSERLQQYSRFLKERSKEIHRRFQSCVNSKRAA